MRGVYLSVVIPCFDEMANLQKGVLEKVKSYLEKKKFDYEVIVVDDGSGDGSTKFVEDFVRNNKKFRLIKNVHSGKAGSVTRGMLSAKGDFVLFTDMDQATPIEELDKLLPFVKSYDVVIGSRSANRKGAPWTRILMAKGMMTLRTLLIGFKNIKDTQCGFKLFSKRAAHEIFTKISKLHKGYEAIDGSNVAAGFDVELLFLANLNKYKIKEVPVNWLFVETRRVSPISDSIEGLRSLLVIKKNAVMGRYSRL